MEKVEVGTAAKGSVELHVLNLSAKTKDKDFYYIYTI